MDEQDDHENSGAKEASRAPKQARSLARYNKLLDAAHELLQTLSPQDLGVYVVAKHAGVPPASAYHLFPTPTAIVGALASRYQAVIEDQVAAAQAPADGMWQTLLKAHMAGLVATYNGNLPMMKVMVGTHSRYARNRDGEFFMDGLARALAQVGATFFHMPMVKGAHERFLVLLGLIDSVWALSFSRHGRITREYELEAAAAAVAYCRTFLPEYLELRS
ncbi:TetR/AcrR family transcriptional regulator [Roseateles cellulosilyticus]|uniref:TetR/AcrR family transcriptional regulator n=1 Tax=Pelomonas cellulosilytica TaxID=2906762 RepID=A0ABS8XZJ4_9BURK|nr:TetR/AcrR family transcriptional regulator [Pelomonas sp. P8]MCE4556242.1 TetR/AcrR family transcriptional regulator [Pelomonas sp. P8]